MRVKFAPEFPGGRKNAGPAATAGNLNDQIRPPTVRITRHQPANLEDEMSRLLNAGRAPRWLACLACGAWFLFAATPARADDEAKRIIAAAVKAHGGAEKLAKANAKPSITKGKLKVFANGMEFDATLEASSDGKRFRQEIKLTIMGTDIEQTVVFDGKEVWIAANGKVVSTLSKKEELELIKEAMHAEKIGNMVLDDKDLEFSIIGEDKVGDTPVVGVRVSKKGRKDVSLYFDKKTHLLKKVESRGMVYQSNQEVAQERIVDEYKDVNGVMRPGKMTVNQDGKKAVEMEFTSYETVDSLDDATFKKP